MNAIRPCVPYALKAVAKFLLLYFLSAIASAAQLITFDNLPDSTILKTEYSGISFNNALILTQGVSLNEYEFPPKSGDNVAVDNGSPIIIRFDSEISWLSGYITYASKIDVYGYDYNNNIIARCTSKYNSNLALSGDAYSHPNEIIQIASMGISKVVIRGLDDGYSFSIDDISYGTGPAPAVPEPSTYLMFAIGILVIYFVKSKNTKSPL